MVAQDATIRLYPAVRKGGAESAVVAAVNAASYHTHSVDDGAFRMVPYSSGSARRFLTSGTGTPGRLRKRHAYRGGRFLSSRRLINLQTFHNNPTSAMTAEAIVAMHAAAVNVSTQSPSLPHSFWQSTIPSLPDLFRQSSGNAAAQSPSLPVLYQATTQVSLLDVRGCYEKVC
jgi:hypothetical protein